jgi:hypothetical protein
VLAVLHGAEGILLAGVSNDDGEAGAVCVVRLADVVDAADAISIAESGALESSERLLQRVSGALSDMPFCLQARGKSAQGTLVHVRFLAPYTRQATQRLWHRTQRVVARSDGSVDVLFGPVAVDAAASWVASLGEMVEVLGDRRLRKALKKGAFAPMEMSF